MGKRKKSSRKPQGPKKQEPLPTTFSCLFCNHEKSVTCKLDKKAGIGSLSCKVCGQQFQSNINYLSAAVDVYSEWVDACDEIANPKEKNVSSSSRSGGGTISRSQQSRGGYGAIDEDDDEDDGDDDRGGYSGKTAVGGDDDEEEDD